MHYYPEDIGQDNIKKLITTNVCSQCGRQLYAYLDEDKKVYLACGSGQHQGIAREYQPPEEDYRSNIRRESKLEKEHGREASKALATIPKQGQLTNAEATTVLNLVYPKASQVEIDRCAIFCHDFGLHPLANEVYLIPFKGKNVMVVGIAANRKMAHALKGDFSFLEDTPRAASEEEIVKQFGKDSEEAEKNIISVTKVQGVGGNLAIGFGLWPKLRQKMAWDGNQMAVVKKDGEVVMESNEPYGLDKGNSKRNMANIHSERQAIDRLPGKTMPQVEVIDAKYTVLPEIGKVDTTTGEIKEEEKPAEGEFHEVEEEQTETPEQTPQLAVDMNWLKGVAFPKIKWSEKTATSFIKSKPEFKGIDIRGSLVEVLSRMSKEQQGKFVAMVQELEELA